MRAVAAITHLTDGDRAAFQETTGEMKAYASMGNNTEAAGDTMRSFISIGKDDDGVMANGGYPSILISYVYDRGRKFFEEKLKYWPDNCMGDSGAFSVWTRGEMIDLNDYIAWCQHYVSRRPDFIAISLDVIPPVAATKREKNRAMKQSLANGDELRAAGLRITEVFHWREPLTHLDALLERRQPGEILGVGGLAGKGSKLLKLAFLRGVFNHVRPAADGLWVPMHGLGIAPLSELCYRFPWFSIDCSSWSTPGRFGQAVGKGGKIIGADKRTADRTMRRIYVGRVLEGWLEQERSLTRMWADRGVRYAP